MRLTNAELEDVIFHCEEMSFISVGIYSRIGEMHPEFTTEQLRDAFLYAIAEFIRQGRLKFLGEGQLFRGDEVPRVAGALRPDLVPNQDLANLIKEGRIWDGAPDQVERIRQRVEFGEELWGPEVPMIGGLRQPEDSSPQGVAALIHSKWPPELEPAFNANLPGFHPLWFEKWEFQWCDEQGRPLES